LQTIVEGARPNRLGRYFSNLTVVSAAQLELDSRAASGLLLLLAGRGLLGEMKEAARNDPSGADHSSIQIPGDQLRSAAKTNRGEKKLRRQWGPALKTSEEGLYAS